LSCIDARRLAPHLQEDAGLRFAPAGAPEGPIVMRHSDHL
jgi:hypothetical protein